MLEDVGSGIGIKNISDLVLKKLHGVFKTKNLTKEEMSK